MPSRRTARLEKLKWRISQHGDVEDCRFAKLGIRNSEITLDFEANMHHEYVGHEFSNHLVSHHGENLDRAISACIAIQCSLKPCPVDISDSGSAPR